MVKGLYYTHQRIAEALPGVSQDTVRLHEGNGGGGGTGTDDQTAAEVGVATDGNLGSGNVQTVLKRHQDSIDAAATATGDVAALRISMGTAASDTHLGAFTGTLIPDNATTKAALQALETAAEAAANAFVDNTDTPAAIVANGLVQGNAAGNALEFINALAAARVSVAPAGNLTSTETQAALVELQTDIDALAVLTAANLLATAAAPTDADGNDNDYNLNLSSGDIIGPKTAGTWTGAPTIRNVYAMLGLATGISPATDDVTGAAGVAVVASREDHKHPRDADLTALRLAHGTVTGAGTHTPFTGATIPDASTTAAALQALETALEARWDLLNTKGDTIVATADNTPAVLPALGMLGSEVFEDPTTPTGYRRRQNAWGAATPPNGNDDANSNYWFGSRFVVLDPPNKPRIFTQIDPATGAAVWVEMTSILSMAEMPATMGTVGQSLVSDGANLVWITTRPEDLRGIYQPGTGFIDYVDGLLAVGTNLLRGHWFYVQSDGTFDGQELKAGDKLVAAGNGPSLTTFAGNWLPLHTAPEEAVFRTPAAAAASTLPIDGWREAPSGTTVNIPTPLVGEGVIVNNPSATGTNTLQIPAGIFYRNETTNVMVASDGSAAHQYHVEGKRQVRIYNSASAGGLIVQDYTESAAIVGNVLEFVAGNWTAEGYNQTGTGTAGREYLIPSTVAATAEMTLQAATVYAAAGIQRIRVACEDWSLRVGLATAYNTTGADTITATNGYPDAGSSWLEFVVDAANNRFITTTGGDVRVTQVVPTFDNDADAAVGASVAGTLFQASGAGDLDEGLYRTRSDLARVLV